LINNNDLITDYGTTEILYIGGCAAIVFGILIVACHICAKKKLLWFKNKSKLPTAASEPHLAFYHRKPTTAVKAVKNPAGSHYLKKSPSPTGSKTPVVIIFLLNVVCCLICPHTYTNI
jgi:hypothetical protein